MIITSLWDESVECIKKVDLTKEFSSWHIKWRVGVITDKDRNDRKYSPDFKIPPIAEKAESYPLKEASLKCNLCLWIPCDYTSAIPTDILLHLQNFDFPIAMVYRFGISYKSDEIFLTNSHMGVRLHDGDDIELMVDDIDNSLLKFDGQMIVHCWLDIPNAFMKLIEKNPSYYGPCIETPTIPWNIANFLKKSEELYKSAIGKNPEFKSHSDVTLALSKKSTLWSNSDGRFHCHKDILTGASSMFATMFSMNQWKEGENGTVDIDDIDEDTMKAVLYHIYTGQFKETEPSNLPNLIYAADKYQLKDLKSWAEIQLMAMECTDSERVDCLVFAQRHQLRQLQAACILMLSTNARLLVSDEFKEKLSKETREEILKMVEKRQVDTKQMSIGNWKGFY